jgi:ketosteroid isomerase-like protein
MEDSWSIAFVKKDQYAMELLLAPTLVYISAAGDVSTRNQLIAEMFDHSAGDLLSMEQRVVTVRVLGDLALVEGTYVIHYKAGSHTVDERGVFTHVYQRARANWVCVNAQRTAVFDQTDEKQKQASRKSNASLPFHIPLVYKGAASTQTPPSADKQQ